MTQIFNIRLVVLPEMKKVGKKIWGVVYGRDEMYSPRRGDAGKEDDSGK